MPEPHDHNLLAGRIVDGPPGWNPGPRRAYDLNSGQGRDHVQIKIEPDLAHRTAHSQSDARHRVIEIRAPHKPLRGLRRRSNCSDTSGRGNEFATVHGCSSQLGSRNGVRTAPLRERRISLYAANPINRTRSCRLTGHYCGGMVMPRIADAPRTSAPSTTSKATL